MNYYTSVLKKYAVFSGRSRRAEYWYFVLFNIIISWILNFIGPATQTGNMSVIAAVYSLAVLIPSIAVGVRRLHDTGRSGWWLLIALIPIIGAIILIVFAVQDSQPGANQYGQNPKDQAGAAPTASSVPPTPSPTV